MTDSAQQILESALQLSAADRAELIGRLAASLPEEDVLQKMEPEVREAWTVEVRRRWEQFERGEVESIDGEMVFRELYQRLGA
jgi:hypothetical protein